jgi:lysophospholipase L1-like esterase
MRSAILSIYFLTAIMILSPLSIHAQDWAGLQVFQSKNKHIPTPDKKEKRVVFMGNSITQGWIETHPEFFAANHYINRGISGQTTPQMLVRFRQDVVALKPAAVVILAGTNDIAGNTGPSTLEMIMDNLASMAEIAAANNIKVILCSVLPAYEYPWRTGLQPAEKIVSLNTMIQHYCKQKGFVYLNYHAALADEQNGMIQKFTNDGVHVTSEGYVVMEQMVQQAIRKVLK